MCSCVLVFCLSLLWLSHLGLSFAMLREDALRFMGELGTRARELKEKRKKVESGIAEFANERLSAKNAKEFCSVG